MLYKASWFTSLVTARIVHVPLQVQLVRQKHWSSLLGWCYHPQRTQALGGFQIDFHDRLDGFDGCNAFTASSECCSGGSGDVCGVAGPFGPNRDACPLVDPAVDFLRCTCTLPCCCVACATAFDTAEFVSSLACVLACLRVCSRCLLHRQ